jgi:protein SCO1/2
MNQKIKIYFPYLLIIFLLIATYNYSYIFINYDFDGYYGKSVNLDAHNFKLKNANGDEVKLDDFRGSNVLLTFGFTKCTGVCPLNLQRFKTLSEKLSISNNLKIKFIFISFDDLRDDEKELQLFLDNFDIPNTTGLLSGIETGLFVADKYRNNITYEIDKIKQDNDHQINHKGFIYLINPSGKLSIVYMQQDLEEDKVIQDIIKLNSKV